MPFSCIFKRYEMKYLITDNEFSELLLKAGMRLKPDNYGKSTICNIYYDTDDYRLIRTSLRKPRYKEKLRVRSYGPARSGSTVFLELKKKYKGVVYKRRIPMKLEGCHRYMKDGCRTADGYEQIYSECDWFMNHYSPEPKAYISYDRTAYVSVEDPGFRVTFDENILGRDYDLDLTKEGYGEKLLPPGKRLMEVKVNGSMPLWFAGLLDEIGIYQTSFSKYGEFYKSLEALHSRSEKTA